MRPIKFRAWNTDEKRMEYNDGIFEFTGVIHVLQDYMKRPGIHGTKIGNMFNGKLMQFTGLRDKNGKEIYEGDIVKFGWQQGIGQIVFGKYVTNNQDNEDMLGWCVSDKERFYAFDPQGTHEVIGNIYENHDLLAKE